MSSIKGNNTLIVEIVILHPLYANGKVKLKNCAEGEATS